MEELELLKKLNSLSFNDKEISKEFKNRWNINLRDVDEFTLSYNPDNQKFNIVMIMPNGYDGYDLCYREIKDFDFLNIENNEIELGR